jgi:hypothetical protein
MAGWSWIVILRNSASGSHAIAMFRTSGPRRLRDMEWT